MRDLVAICFENFSRPRSTTGALIVLASCLVACSERARDPVEMFAQKLSLDAAKPLVVTRALQRGVYLVEVREDGIDARVTVGLAGELTTLENRLPRYGAVYKVVSLTALGEVRIEAASADYRANRGAIAVRIARWARAPGDPATALESGYAAQSSAAEQ